jgi:predicted metal-dependent phosphoesterase TrpH
MLSRRRFLRTGALLGGVAALPATPAAAMTQPRGGTGVYLYLPFEVPAGVNRIDVRLDKAIDESALGVGLFDQRGPAYQSPGFRGMYGEERSEFFVAAHEAAQSFHPGTIEQGRWTVLVPVFRAPAPTPITVTVTLTFGPQRPPFRLGPEVGVVRDAPGWYRGDLHCHTPESSDAWVAGDALDVRGWGDECRRLGLDYASMTDHNVLPQNFNLAEEAGDDVLLMPGVEMTNFFHGHATVCGMAPDDWLDFRQRPLGVELQPHEARITDFFALTREMGAFAAAAHPLAPLPGLTWDFFVDGEADPAAYPDSFEVWTGQHQPQDEAAVAAWDNLLNRGVRVYANGGSDLHGQENILGTDAGTPTTVVHAEALSKSAIVAALRRGRSFITRLPDGAETYLSATGPGGQRQIMGGTIYGGPDDVARVEVLVRNAAGKRCAVWTNGAPLITVPVTEDEQRVTADVPIGSGGYVRAELRGEPFIDPANPSGGRTDMEALTNPIFLEQGPVPDDVAPDDTRAPGDADDEEEEPPRSGDQGDRRREDRPDDGGSPDHRPGPSPDQGRGTDRPAEPDPAAALPATGATQTVVGAAGMAAGVAGVRAARRAGERDDAVPVAHERRHAREPVPMTLTEFRHHAGTGGALRDRPVRLVGLVTDTDGPVATLTRWGPDCCGRGEGPPVHVELDLGRAAATEREWVAATGQWVPDSGARFASRSRLRVTDLVPLDEPLPRREA